MSAKILSNPEDILDTGQPFDVCIIGSGPAGTVLGKRLVERGIRTVIVESGGSLLRWFVDFRLKGLAAYESSGDANYPVVRTRARALGGTSNFWTGRCERFHPSDFNGNPYVPEGNPWPISYDDIEHYYERAEATLRVRGGVPSQYAPPRRNGFPFSPKTDISTLQAMVKDLGVTVDESPTATPAKSFRFFRVQKEILPGFTSSPAATLLSGMTVTRLLADSSRCIVGAQACTLDGVTKVIRAKKFVACCGGIETPRLLLLSKSGAFPNGIGNSYDRVGRGFNEHAGINCYGKIRHRKGTVYPRHKIGRSHQMYEQFRSEGLGSVLPVFIQSWVFPHHLIQPKLRDIPGVLAGMVGRTTRPTFYIGATIEMEPYDENRVTLAKEAKDRFGDPLAHLSYSFTAKDRLTLDRTQQMIFNMFDRLEATDISEAEVTWSRHHIGTCRMGDDPKASVIDRHLRVHESPNLYLCGSEVFVTGSACPPVLTITALAHRLSDHLVTQFGKQVAEQ
ncbi:MAG: GMC family oxidoreductase [Nitrospirae bacterium]|nr:GMC family oxidoreductase [Nitrospirota bacterium]